MYLPKKAGEDPNMMLLLGDYYDYEAEPYLGNLVTIPYTMSGTTIPETGYVGGVPTQIQYFTENFNDDYDYGNTTYISVQVAFSPSNWWTFSRLEPGHTVLEYRDNESENPKTFYYDPEKREYWDADEEVIYVATYTGKFDKDKFLGPYTNGICYYNIPIGTKFPATDASELGAVRNTFYKANITKLIAPGEPGEPDPLKPVIKDKVFLAVEMTVAPWSSQDMGEIELGK